MHVRDVKPGEILNSRIVLGPAAYSPNSRNKRVLARCLECGKERALRLDSILDHNCPCQTQLIKSDSVAKKALLRSYKKWSMKARGTTFELADEQFFEMVQQNCYYCGAPPARAVWPPTGNRIKERQFICNGIDRLDSSKGYILGNCVPCCTRCNFMKGTMSPAEFIDQIKAIANHILAASL